MRNKRARILRKMAIAVIADKDMPFKQLYRRFKRLVNKRVWFDPEKEHTAMEMENWNKR